MQCFKDSELVFKCDPDNGQLRHFSKNTNQCSDCTVTKCKKCDNFRYNCVSCEEGDYTIRRPFYWKGIMQQSTACMIETTTLPYC